MKPKVMVKMGIDFLMTVLLICLMAYQITGELFHEWIGMGSFVLFIAHHALNFRSYQSIAKGRYTAVRAANAVVDFLVLISVLGHQTNIIRTNHDS